MEIHKAMKKKILYAPPILEIFVIGAEANFCVSGDTEADGQFRWFASDNDLSGMFEDE